LKVLLPAAGKCVIIAAMRPVVKVVVAAVVIVGGCAIVAAIVLRGRQAGDEQTVPEIVQPEITVFEGNDWPMFRTKAFGQGLRDIA
jgi:hypothetical protein